MAVPKNKALYNRVKAKIVAKNPKHSAYRSGAIVRTEKGKKTYKEGGTIFRPTKRITKDTPKTMKELSTSAKKKAIAEKKKKGRVKKY